MRFTRLAIFVPVLLSVLSVSPALGQRLELPENLKEHKDYLESPLFPGSVEGGGSDEPFNWVEAALKNEDVKDYNERQEREAKERIRRKHPESKYFVGFSRTIHAREGAAYTFRIWCLALGMDTGDSPGGIAVEVGTKVWEDIERVRKEAKDVGIDIKDQKSVAILQLWVKHREGAGPISTNVPRSWIFYGVWKLPGNDDVRSGDAVFLRTRTKGAENGVYYRLTADVGRGNRDYTRNSGLGLVTVVPDRSSDPKTSDQIWWIEKVKGRGAITSGDEVFLRTRTKGGENREYYHLTADVGRGNRKYTNGSDLGLVTVIPDRSTDPKSDQIWWIEKVNSGGAIKSGDEVFLRTRTKGGENREYYHLTADVGRGNRDYTNNSGLGLVSVIPDRSDDAKSDQVWWIEIP